MKTILTVEDDKEVRDMIVEITESLGYEVLEAQNAREAIEMVQKNHIDLILLDINMPGARGNHFLKFIRSRKVRIPVIIVSGYLEKDILRQISELEVPAVLTKPLRVDRLQEELDKIFASS